MSVSFHSALDMILRGPGCPGYPPVRGGRPTPTPFAVAGRDEERLVESCLAWLKDHPIDAREGVAESRAIWILDRLLPLDDPTPFDEFRHDRFFGVGLYAWGRRAPDEMVRAVDSDDLSNCGPPVVAAWIDTRESDQELLRWYEVCAERGWNPCLIFGGGELPISEYCKRSPDRAHLLAFLETVPEEEGVATALEHLLRDVATGDPPSQMCPSFSGDLNSQPPELWAQMFEWNSRLQENLLSTLRDFGEHELLAMCQTLPGRDMGQVLGSAAIEFWISQHTLDHVDRLLQIAAPSYPSYGYSAIRRLAQILPQDQIETWDSLLVSVQGHLGSFPMCRFVEWLTPESRHVLVPWFDGVDVKWGTGSEEWPVCAMHGWISKAPKAEVEEWAARPGLPLWQRLLCDRTLCAPAALRPPPLLHFGQDVEADFRLIDPLNIRAM